MGRLVTGSDNVHSGSGLVNRTFSVLKRLNLQDLLLDMLRKLGMPFISKREKGPPGARIAGDAYSGQFCALPEGRAGGHRGRPARRAGTTYARGPAGRAGASWR